MTTFTSTSAPTDTNADAHPNHDRAASLKQATSRAHEALDADIMRFDPFGSAQRYGCFLQMQYAFHRDVAALFEDATLNRLFPHLKERSRLAQVIADLQDVGVPLPDLPAPVFSAASFSLPAAIGWLYVEEGSNLGGAFLYKMAARLGLHCSHGARHLAPHPEGRAPNWRGFVAQLNAVALDASAEAQVIAAACDAFARVSSHVRQFCRVPSPGMAA